MMIQRKGLFLIVLISQLLSAQISFEKGYYLSLKGEKVNCYIKNIDWDTNPSEFIYTLEKDAQEELQTVETVSGFEIYNSEKYVSVLVDIDRSSDNVGELSRQRRPEFKREKVFLKVLLEGPASLYSYKRGNSIRYFYTIEEVGSTIQPLVNKRFRTSGTEIRENVQFKQQLLDALKCTEINGKLIESSTYTKIDLTRLFQTYNACKNPDLIVENEKVKRNLLHISIRPGLNLSSLDFLSTSASRRIEYGSQLGFRIGLEAEIVLPFNKNKWGVLLEPTYQYYTSEQENTATNAEYSSIELPLSVRHHFYLNDRSSVFINAGILIDIPFESTVNSRDVSPSNNYTFGVGYRHHRKISLELRHQTTRDILSDFRVFSGNYKPSVALIFGYTLF